MFLLFLEMANNYEESVNASQNIDVCVLRERSGTVTGRGSRAQVNHSMGKHIVYFQHLSCKMIKAHSIHPMLSLKETVIPMSFYTALQHCLNRAPELTQFSHILPIFYLRSPQNTILLVFIPLL